MNCLTAFTDSEIEFNRHTPERQTDREGGIGEEREREGGEEGGWEGWRERDRQTDRGK